MAGKMKDWAGGISSAYRSLWRRLTGWRLFLFYAVHYTLLFAAIQHVIFSPFAELGRSFMWYVDAVPQHYARLVYIRQLWRESVQRLLAGEGWHLPLYDFRENLALMDTQMGLPQFLAVFWPSDRLDGFYNLYVRSNYYWMGLTFSAFGFYWKQKPLPVLTGAVSYAFCAMALFAGVRHPHFAVPMVLLPVLLIGSERVLRGERAFMFTVSVFLSLTTQNGIYFSCMQAILVLLYIAVRFADVCAGNRLRGALLLTGRLAAWGGTAVLLAAPSWLPALIGILGSDRVGNTVTLLDNMVRYTSDYYTRFFGQFVISPRTVGYWTYLGFSVLTLPALALLFVRRRREERSLRALFVALSVMLFIPGVGYVMSGFSNVSNRWCFGYAFCAAAILMFMTQKLPSLTKKERRGTLVLVAAYGLVAVCAGVHFGSFDMRAIALLLAATALMAACRALGLRGERLTLVALAITCLSVVYTGYQLYDEREGNYANEFLTDASSRIEAGQYASMAQSAVIAGDDGFFRVTGDRISTDEMNMAFHYGLNGVSAYPYYGWSGAYLDWVSELEMPRLGARQLVYGRTPNASALALGGVRYYASRVGATMPRPYGFAEADSVVNGGARDVILLNENAPGIGYTYDRYMTREGYDALVSVEKQEAQLSAVLLEEAPTLAGLAAVQPQTTAQRIPCEVADMDGVTWEDGLLIVKKRDATMTLTFAGLPRSETYLRIVDHVSFAGDFWEITVGSGDVSMQAAFYPEDDVYTHGQHSQTFNLGYSEDGLTQATITFPFESAWGLADVEIWCQPMERFAAQTAALAKEALQSVVTDWHSLRGEITVSGDRMLVLAIPYAKGWTAYVDGEKAKLYQANTAFMAVELTEGTHEVELRYSLPGMRAGMAMSAAGVVGLCALVFAARRRGKRRKL